MLHHVKAIFAPTTLRRALVVAAATALSACGGGGGGGGVTPPSGNAPPSNNPPLALRLTSAFVPDEVPYGETVSFSVLETGDPTPIQLIYGPAGMTVEAGVVMWRAELPMFSPKLAVNFRVGTSETSIAGSFTVLDPSREQPWRRTGFQVPQRDGALQIVDLDADGEQELLVAGTDAIIEYSWTGTDYRQAWVYPYAFRPGSFLSVAAANTEGDEHAEIFIGGSDKIVKLVGPNRTPVPLEDAIGGSVARLRLADLDNDGNQELIALIAEVGRVGFALKGPARIMIIDPRAMKIDWMSEALGTEHDTVASFAVGNLDGDVALEIVTNLGHVLDTGSRELEWAHSGYFGDVVQAADIDGNGIEEIVVTPDIESSITVYSAVLRAPIATIGPRRAYATTAVADIDQDGAAEIIAGSANGGAAVVFSYDATSNSFNETARIETQQSSVSAIGVGDVDGDDAIELVLGTNVSSSNDDELIVAGLDGSIEWSSPPWREFLGPIYGGALARIGGGQSRLVFGSSRTGIYGGTRLALLDPANGALTVSDDFNLGPDFSIGVADYDNDGVDEAFVGAGDSYNARIVALDLASMSEEWAWGSGTGIGGGARFAIADFNGDGSMDLAALTERSPEGLRIELIDVRNNTLFWRSEPLTTGRDIYLAAVNISGHAFPGLLVATGNGLDIYARHDQGFALRATADWSAFIAPPGYIDALVADVDGDGRDEIYAIRNGTPRQTGLAETKLVRFDDQLREVGSAPLPLEPYALFLEDLNTVAGRKNIMVSHGTLATLDSPWLTAIDPFTGAEIWHLPGIQTAVNAGSLFYVDPDGDGVPQISFGTYSGMYLTR